MTPDYLIEILQIVRTVLHDVAEDPTRLNRAIEISERQITDVVQKREEYRT